MHMFLPLAPKGKPTHQNGFRFNRKTGTTFKTQKQKAWEAELKAALAPYADNAPDIGGCPVYLKWVFHYATKDRKKLSTWKTSKPDTDNLVKTPKDIMQKLDFFKDDSQVAYEVIQKVWSTEPGIEITLAPMPADIFDLIYLEANDPDWAV